MATRTSIRPRPVDVQKQLIIVRNLEELDSTDGIREAELAHENKKKHGKDIPVPEVGRVPTYHRDYLPVFEKPITYIHGRGGVGYQVDGYVEYDLDNDDEDWLEKYNQGQTRLQSVKLERMLWKLDVACGEATDRVLTAAGASQAEKNAATTLAVIDHLPKMEALQMLRKTIGGREAMLHAVYDYWAGKRKRTGKPMMRRLQAPTPANDTNPYNVFRVREKVNRPLTRRRRENTDECLEKLQLIRDNLSQSSSLVAHLVKREQKKRDIMLAELEMLKLQLRLRSEPKSSHEALEAQTIQDFKTKLKSKADTDSKPKQQIRYDMPDGVILPAEAGTIKLAKKRKRELLEIPPREFIARLPAPPAPPPDEPMFLMQVDTSRLKAAMPELNLPATPDFANMQARLARGGRVVFTRVDALADEEASSSGSKSSSSAAAPWPPRPTAPAVLEVVAQVEQQYQQRMHQQLLVNMGRPPNSTVPVNRLTERPISAMATPRAATPKASLAAGNTMAAAAAAVAAAAAAAAATSTPAAAVAAAAPAPPAAAATPAPQAAPSAAAPAVGLVAAQATPAAATPAAATPGAPPSGSMGLPPVGAGIILKKSAGPKPDSAAKPPLASSASASGLKRGPGRPPKVTGMPMG